MDDVLDTFYWAVSMRSYHQVVFQEPLIYEMMNFFIKKPKEYSKRKIIAAICAAPIALHRAGLLKGKKYTCYPGVEKDIVTKERIQDSSWKQQMENSLRDVDQLQPLTAYTIAERWVLREGIQYNKLLKNKNGKKTRLE